MRTFLLAAALFAAIGAAADAAVSRTSATAVAKAKVRTGPQRVRVNATTRTVMEPARNGNGRWTFWLRNTPPAPVTNVPPPRPQ